MASVADMLGGMAPAATPAPNPTPRATLGDGADGPNPFDRFDAPSAAAAPKRTVADMLGMGVRGIMTGAGGLADILAGPANATVNAVTGSHLSTSPGRDTANAAADTLGLAAPQSDQERFANAVVEGGTQGLATAGLAGSATGAPGMAGYVARNVAAHPVIDTAASAVSGASAETARQHGAGPVGQLAAGLVGGVAGVAGARRVADIVSGITERYGANAAKVVTEVPREAVIDEKGALTEEGKDVAAHNDLHPDQLKGAYDDVDAAIRQPEATPAPEQGAAAPEAAAEPVQAAPRVEPTGPLETPPEAPPETAAAEAANADLPASAQERLAQAQSEGVDLSQGQATQDFATQEREQTLRSEASPEGNTARQFFIKQQQQIADAVDRFKQAFGAPEATAEERGQVVKDAITSLRDAGKAGVKALYEQARNLAQSLGDEGSNLIRLNTQPLLDAMRGIWSDEAVPDQVRRALKQQAAKYGLIGDNPQTIEGETSVQLRDNAGEPAGKISFVGEPEPLTVLNAEDLRQKINQLYDADNTKQTQGLKKVIDDAVQEAVERAANEGTGDVGQAFQAARNAHAQQKATFSAKDIVQKLIDWKKGTRTPQVSADQVLRTIFQGGPDAVSDLKRLKAVLLSNPTPKSKAAWDAIRAHAVAKIFDQAMVLNANPGEGALGTISGAKLNTAIAKFGVDRLRVLLAPEEFNQLMKLRRIVGDATIPIDRTTNPSGTAQKVINFLAQQGSRLAGVARFVPLARDVFLGAQEVINARQAKATAAGISNFTPEAAAKADRPPAEPADYARKFISVAGSDEMMAPLITSAANEQHR